MAGTDECIVLARIRKQILLAKENYKNDKIMIAHQIVLNIDETIGKVQSETTKQSAQSDLKNDLSIQEIRLIGGQVQGFFTLMTESMHWKAWPIGGSETELDMKVSTHRTEKTGEFYFKAEGVVAASKLCVSLNNLQSHLI